ncbi:MAG: hypothetical protein R6X23_01825 [Acidimicrobiia bacterium]
MSEPAHVPEPEPAAAADAPGDDEPGDDLPGDEGPGLPPPTPVESLVGALLEAGPEVAEHVVRAAQELLLAVQVIVDAADRAVQEQQRLQADAPAPAAGADADPGAAGAQASVRHLDIAE